MRWLAFVAALGMAGAVAEAQAPLEASNPDDGVRLSWVRARDADACIDGPALAEEVSRRLGRDPFVGETRQTIEGVIGREADHWVARLYNRDASGVELGRRELTSESDDCRALDSAVALAVALAIDPEAALSPDPPDPPDAPDPIADPEPSGEPTDTPLDPLATAEPVRGEPLARDLTEPSAAPADPPVEDAATEPASLDARVIASVWLAVDLIPGPAAGVSVFTDAWIVDPIRWRIGILYFPEVSTGGASATFGFGLTAATLDACVRAFTAGPVSGVGCVGGAVGALHAVVYDPVPAEPGDYAWGAVRASVELGVELEERVYLALALSGAVPVVRWAFRVEGRESPEFQQPWVIPAGNLAIGVRFW